MVKAVVVRFIYYEDNLYGRKWMMQGCSECRGPQEPRDSPHSEGLSIITRAICAVITAGQLRLS